MSEVDQVIAELKALYGPGNSNGVSAILAHDNLPDQFDKSCWSEWFFKPADAAFDAAHDMGLIAPWKLSSKWVFTDLGSLVAARVRRDLNVPTPTSDASAEGR